MSKIGVLIFALILLPFLSEAQQYNLRQFNNVKVVVAGDTLDNAWGGGLNAPLFSKIHLNSDNQEDLYVFDKINGKSFTFLADNSTGTWSWQYAPSYEALFPAGLQNWVLLRDYDNDGRKDIFTADDLNYFVYRNITPPNGVLQFRLQPKILKYGFQTMSFGEYTLPSVTDIDNDGDLDILVFSAGARDIHFLKNTSMESGFRLDSLKFVEDNGQWGNLRQCGNHLYNFGTFFCKVSGINHYAGGSILALDLDADADKDILVGLELNPQLVQHTNQGTVTAANFNASGYSPVYPVNTTAANFVNYPAAYSEDVTFDGKKDLLVSPFLHDNADLADLNHSSWLYTNSAFAPSVPPVYTFQKKNFLQDEMIDVGESAIPAFEDVDADGDQDLLVSNYADYRSGTGAANFKSSISLFTNVGTPAKPVFRLTDPDYLGFSAENFKGIHPQFGDLNGDGTKDLIVKVLDVSATAAYLKYILNTAQPGQPFSFNLANLTDAGVDLNPADVPYVYDLDNDGDLDILLGTQKGGSGGLHYIRRTGTDASSYASWDETYNMNVVNIPVMDGFSPVLANLDNDNNPELIAGDYKGILRVYPNILNNLSGTVTALQNLLYNDQLNSYLPAFLGNFGKRVNLHIAATDLDGDARPEIVIGTNGGGLTYLKSESALGVKNDFPATEFNFAVYPNPVSEIFTISGESAVKITLFDATGKEVKLPDSGFRKTQEINLSNLSNGVYFLKATTKDNRSSGRTVVVQH